MFPQFPADMLTVTKETLYGKLRKLCNFNSLKGCSPRTRTTPNTDTFYAVIAIIIIFVLDPFPCQHELDGISLMAFLQARQFCADPDCNLNFLKLSLISWVHVLRGLPFPLWPPTSINLQLLTGFSLSILSTCQNHLFYNSSDNFLSLRLTWYIHRTICMSVRAIRLMSLSVSGQVLLIYSMTLLTQAECNFPFVLCENTRNVRRDKSPLNFFQPDLIQDIELASAPPHVLSMSPR